LYNKHKEVKRDCDKYLDHSEHMHLTGIVGQYILREFWIAFIEQQHVVVQVRDGNNRTND